MLMDYVTVELAFDDMSVNLTLFASSRARSQSCFRDITKERLAYEIWLLTSMSISWVSSSSAVDRSPSMHASRAVVMARIYTEHDCFVACVKDGNVPLDEYPEVLPTLRSSYLHLR
jgi:hypothetical protein